MSVFFTVIGLLGTLICSILLIIFKKKNKKLEKIFVVLAVFVTLLLIGISLTSSVFIAFFGFIGIVISGIVLGLYDSKKKPIKIPVISLGICALFFIVGMGGTMVSIGQQLNNASKSENIKIEENKESSVKEETKKTTAEKAAEVKAAADKAAADKAAADKAAADKAAADKAAADKAAADKAAADKAAAEKAAAEAAKPKQILGSSKEQVKELLKAYKINTAYQNNVDPNAIKFEDKNYIIVVEFDSNGLAEGVSYLSFDGAYSGKGSYVDLNYDKIINFATGGGDYPIENNVNPAVGFEYPTEIYIGTMHR